MNLTPLFAQSIFSTPLILLAIIVIPVVIIIGLVAVLSRYTKVGPNQVLVVSGRKRRYVDPDGTVGSRGFRIVKGGGTFVYPVVEKVDEDDFAREARVAGEIRNLAQDLLARVIERVRFPGEYELYR
jgi:uncharacterized membrane protein YqiK